MRTTLQAIARLCRRGNPQRAIVVLHHSLTGRAGAAKTVGYDRASFSRNSKALHAWTRGQINLAPTDPHNNDRLIVACGKCSNGPEFAAFGIRLNPETMIYECDATVNVPAWQSEITGERVVGNLSPDAVHKIVLDLSENGIGPKKSQVVEALMEQTGCAKSAAYKAVDRASRAARITLSPETKTYITDTTALDLTKL